MKFHLQFWHFLSICLFWKSIQSYSIFNDLSMQYEDSSESDTNTTQKSERRWLLLEKIQSLASTMIQNLSQICPLNQHQYPKFVNKVVRSTLGKIYEKEETLAGIQYYERILPIIVQTLERCMAAPTTKISIQEFFSHDYPEEILHLDLLQDAEDSSKWYDFRMCIRTREKSKFYPGLIPSMFDALWNSFLLGYFGCMEHWMAVDAWSYMDAAQSTIMLPIYKRWISKFPTISGSVVNEQKIGNNGSYNSWIDKSEEENVNVSSVKYMLESLEKCNVILFMKNPTDPIPCFKDVIQDFE